MAMANIYEKDRPSLDEYVKHFSVQDKQVGAVFLINGEEVGLDTCGIEETFAKIFKKLVESYALDAIDWFDAGRMPSGARLASGNWVMPNELGNEFNVV